MPIATVHKMDNGLTVFVNHTFINAPLDINAALDVSEKLLVVRRSSIPANFRFEHHELLDALPAPEMAESARAIAARKAPKDETPPANQEAQAPAPGPQKEEKPHDDGQPKETGRLREAPAPGEVRREEKVIATIELLPAEAPKGEKPAQPTDETTPTVTTMQDEALQKETIAAEAPSVEEAHAAIEAPTAMPQLKAREDLRRRQASNRFACLETDTDEEDVKDRVSQAAPKKEAKEPAPKKEPVPKKAKRKDAPEAKAEAAEEEDPKASARQWRDAFVQQIVQRVGHGSREDFLTEVRKALGTNASADLESQILLAHRRLVREEDLEAAAFPSNAQRRKECRRAGVAQLAADVGAQASKYTKKCHESGSCSEGQASRQWAPTESPPVPGMLPWMYMPSPGSGQASWQPWMSMPPAASGWQCHMEPHAFFYPDAAACCAANSALSSEGSDMFGLQHGWSEWGCIPIAANTTDCQRSPESWRF